MAFTQAPENSTYSSRRIKLTSEMTTRPGIYTTKDEDFQNCYIDVVKTKNVEDKRSFIVKRPGTASFISSQQAAAVRGMYFWADQYKLFYAVDNDVYVHSLNAGTTTQLSAVFGTTSGDVGFCEYLYDTGSAVVVVTDGTTLSTIDSSNTVVASADPDLPAPHLPVPVFLDGYLLLAKTSTGDIYNSDLNDPLAWTAGNVITAEIEGDWVKHIAKMNNYFLAFGKNTIEYFWDAGIETGSPFQRNDSVVKYSGYLGAFAQHGNRIYFVGQDTQGQVDVYQLEDLKINQVGTPIISRYLNNSGATYTNLRGSIISVAGKNFYVLYGGTYTFVLDIETRIWTRWAYQDETNFPITYAVNIRKINDVLPVFALDASNSQLFYFSDEIWQDVATDYTLSVVTPLDDFDTMNRKAMARLSIVGDRPPANAELLVQWSDDDYQTFNSGLTVEMNQDLPCCYRLGRFRQRAFKLSYTGDQPMRLSHLEADLNKGNS